MMRSLTQAWSSDAGGAHRGQRPRAAGGRRACGRGGGGGRDGGLGGGLGDAPCGRRAGRGPAPDQLILPHGVPADDALVLGHAGQDLLVAVLERLDGHAGPLRLPSGIARAFGSPGRGTVQGTRGSSVSGPIRGAPCPPDCVRERSAQLPKRHDLDATRLATLTPLRPENTEGGQLPRRFGKDAALLARRTFGARVTAWLVPASGLGPDATGEATSLVWNTKPISPCQPNFRDVSVRHSDTLARS